MPRTPWVEPIRAPGVRLPEVSTRGWWRGDGLGLGRSQGAGLDVGAEAMEETALGAVPIHAAHGGVEEEFGASDDDSGEAGLVSLDESGADAVIDATLHVESFGGTAGDIADLGGVDGGDLVTLGEGPDVPLQVLASGECLVEAALLPDGTAVEAVGITGAEPEALAEIALFKIGDAPGQGGVEFAHEERSDGGGHAWGELFADSATIQVEERIAHGHRVGTEGENPRVFGLGETGVQGAAVGKIGGSNGNDLGAILTGEFQGAVGGA